MSYRQILRLYPDNVYFVNYGISSSDSLMLDDAYMRPPVAHNFFM